MIHWSRWLFQIWSSVKQWRGDRSLSWGFDRLFDRCIKPEFGNKPQPCGSHESAQRKSKHQEHGELLTVLKLTGGCGGGGLAPESTFEV